MQTAIDELLLNWRHQAQSAPYNRMRDLGTKFEELCVIFLNHDSEQKLYYRNAQSFYQWKQQYHKTQYLQDAGIDLVAERVDSEGFVAIQCKNYSHAQQVAKSELDKFLAESSTPDFSQRLIIDTTLREWSALLENTLNNQRIKVKRLGLQHLRESSIDWKQYFKTGRLSKPTLHQLKTHQRQAVTKICAALSSRHSRGKVIMACGTGKTLTALRSAEQLVGPGGQVLYLVPSLALMSQTIHYWSQQSTASLRAFAVCSDSQVGKHQKSQDDSSDLAGIDLAFPAHTDPAKLAEKISLDAAGQMTVVFATYQSSLVIEQAQKHYNLARFDLVVCDEAHRTASALATATEPSDFTRIHYDHHIATDRRLYITATPKVFTNNAKIKAGQAATTLCSMDDSNLYGPVLYELSFATAVRLKLLTDYRVIVLTLLEEDVAKFIDHFSCDDQSELKLDDVGYVMGCLRALAKVDTKLFAAHSRDPMRRAIAFCKDIKSSQQITQLFNSISETGESLCSDSSAHHHADYRISSRHIDGTFNASKRADTLQWLDEVGDCGECRVLTNARCLTEGVDVPALDAILFIHPRKSQIEVVQAIGRVMRVAENKSMGYIILPVVIPSHKSAEHILAEHEKWGKIWQMLNAILSHDVGFEAELMKIKMGYELEKISIISLADWSAPRPVPEDAVFGDGEVAKTMEMEYQLTNSPPLAAAMMNSHHDLAKAILTKMVEQCGTVSTWEHWGHELAASAQRYAERISQLTSLDSQQSNESYQLTILRLFEEFSKELQANLNPNITHQDVSNILAQHLIAAPVMDQLWPSHHPLITTNSVAQTMQTVLRILDPAGASLKSHPDDNQHDYHSLRSLLAEDHPHHNQQTVIQALNQQLFHGGAGGAGLQSPTNSTPVQIADFILHSVEHLLGQHFNTTLSQKDLCVLDPFAGTGIFIARLLQSSLIDSKDLARKYEYEIYANESSLSAYYLGLENIQATYHKMSGDDAVFPGMCFTDSLCPQQETDAMVRWLSDNSKRRLKQMQQAVAVIVTHPPWELDENQAYATLYDRVEHTFAAQSKRRQNWRSSYRLVLRWATDRLAEPGIIAFITGNSWLYQRMDAGIRAALAQEFTAIYIIDLCPKNSDGKTQGADLFDHHSQDGAAIIVLVREAASHQSCKIKYYAMPDLSSCQQILDKIQSCHSMKNIDTWQELIPDRHYDWLHQRESGFNELYPVGTKWSGRHSNAKPQAIFNTYYNGYGTGMDHYLYNFSAQQCEKNAKNLLNEYRQALTELSAAGDSGADKISKVTQQYQNHISWTRTVRQQLSRGQNLRFSQAKIVLAHYRPFIKQYLYADHNICFAPHIAKQAFTVAAPANLVIYTSGLSSKRPFSVLMSHILPDRHLIALGVGFVRYTFKQASSSSALVQHDNIADAAHNAFQIHYADRTITKDDIFYYVYGVLHARDFRKAYVISLAKSLPRVPFAEDFWGFARAGKQLCELHVGYESCDEYPLAIRYEGTGIPQSKDYLLSSVGMKWHNQDVSSGHYSTLAINDLVRLVDIPPEAHEYVVDGRSPLGWYVDRYKLKVTHGSSNNPNAWFAQPEQLVSALRRIVYLSVETVRIINNLPSAQSAHESHLS